MSSTLSEQQSAMGSFLSQLLAGSDFENGVAEIEVVQDNAVGHGKKTKNGRSVLDRSGSASRHRICRWDSLPSQHHQDSKKKLDSQEVKSMRTLRRPRRRHSTELEGDDDATTGTAVSSSSDGTCSTLSSSSTSESETESFFTSKPSRGSSPPCRSMGWIAKDAHRYRNRAAGTQRPKNYQSSAA
ncbi:expressed unknown protein [Seminavis robusta]|uniref:Uncharacterized protein n=1 Tax=Seminavis robusta TaxID=568900 RepID=A0A9N8DPX3_9STRA|nr:expressed unknown protein [Seminavis robusta]|eukprot:Sro254_g100230.1 n/a (185) ;mRNA; f:76859-77413